MPIFFFVSYVPSPSLKPFFFNFEKLVWSIRSKLSLILMTANWSSLLEMLLVIYWKVLYLSWPPWSPVDVVRRCKVCICIFWRIHDFSASSYWNHLLQLKRGSLLPLYWRVILRISQAILLFMPRLENYWCIFNSAVYFNK